MQVSETPPTIENHRRRPVSVSAVMASYGKAALLCLRKRRLSTTEPTAKPIS